MEHLKSDISENVNPFPTLSTSPSFSGCESLRLSECYCFFQLFHRVSRIAETVKVPLGAKIILELELFRIKICFFSISFCFSFHMFLSFFYLRLRRSNLFLFLLRGTSENT